MTTIGPMPSAPITNQVEEKKAKKSQMKRNNEINRMTCCGGRIGIS